MEQSKTGNIPIKPWAGLPKMVKKSEKKQGSWEYSVYGNPFSGC
jgi:hypothetical protein